MTFDLFAETRNLSDALDALSLPAGVSHVYNPLAYMRTAHERYLSRFAGSSTWQSATTGVGVKAPRAWDPRPYLILGMNPGPWGMVQTGVPFGDVPHALTILGYSPHLREATPTPTLPVDRQHPNRPVVGFGCNRVEASGDRLWAGLGEVFAPNTTDRVSQINAVLAQCFAMNYCPLAYFAADKAGTNVTSEELAKSGPRRDVAYTVWLDGWCGPYLRRVMTAMDTRVVLAIGRYAERKAKVAVSLLPDGVPRPKVVYLTHPSPLATRSAAEWATMARGAMEAANVMPSQTGVA